MTHVLFTHANFIKNDTKQMRKMRPYPPLATLYAASAVREAGYEVSLFDGTFSDSVDEFRRTLARSRPDVLIICEDLFNFIAKMCLDNMRRTAFQMLSTARKYDIPVIVAGPDVSDYPGDFIQQGADFAVIGEPESTLIALLDRLFGKSSAAYEDIRGIAYCNGNPHMHVTAFRQPRQNLDNLPEPAWDLVDMRPYRNMWKKAHGYFSLNLVTSRGCPYQCTWCAKPIWGNHYAQRSAERVVDEIETLQSRYHPSHIWFVDDIFGMTPNWIDRFERQINAAGCRIPFTIQTRIDLLAEESVSSLAKAGCREVWIGVESGSQKILDAMKKGVCLDQVYRARRSLLKHGIKTCFFVQFGYPGETWEDINATVAMIRKTLPDDVGISVSYPLPGTEFYRQVESQLNHKRTWKDSNDLEVMFRGQYQSPFYRKLHQSIHREITLKNRLKARLKDAGAANEEIAELDRLLEDWFELGRMEVQHRNEPN